MASDKYIIIEKDRYWTMFDVLDTTKNNFKICSTLEKEDAELIRDSLNENWMREQHDVTNV